MRPIPFKSANANFLEGLSSSWCRMPCAIDGKVKVGSTLWRNKKAFLHLPSLYGKPEHDEKDISTLRSEAPQQARLSQAHVYGQRPKRFERTSPQGTQEDVREFGAPPQRHRSLRKSIHQPCAAKGNPTGLPFFMRPKQGATALEPCTKPQTMAFRAPRHAGCRPRRRESLCHLRAGPAIETSAQVRGL